MHKKANSSKTRQTNAYYLSAGITGLIVASLGPSIPLYADTANVEPSQLGVLFTALFSGLLFGSVWAGRIFTTISGHTLIALSLIGTGVTIGSLPLIDSMMGYTLIWLVLGSFIGVVEVGMNTLVLWVDARKSTRSVSIMHCLFGVGALLAPAIIGISLAVTGTITFAYWTIAAITVPAAFYTIRVTQPSPPHNNPVPNTATPIPWLVVGTALLLFVYVGAEVSFAGWLTSYAMQSSDLALSNAAYLTALFWITVALGRLLGIVFAKWVTVGCILATSIIGCFISALLLYWLGSSILFLLIGVLMMGLSMACIFPMAFLFMEQHITVTGAVSSWCLVGASLGGMIIPFGIGHLII